MHPWSLRGSAAAVALALAASAGTPATAQSVKDNVSRAIRLSKDLGIVEPSKEINITVHLKPADKAAFDKAVDALYEPGSPTFHKWMTDEDLRKFGPTATEREAVRRELESHGLNIVAEDDTSFTMRAHGTVADVAAAFQTEIHQFSHGRTNFRANVRNARLAGVAGDYISSVAGLESHQARPLLRRAVSLKTKKPLAGVPLRKNISGGFLESLSTTNCLSAPAEIGLQYGGSNTLPLAVYSGNVYDPQEPCDYTPAQLQAVYNMQNAYKDGYDGKGQTIVLIEAFGYPMMKVDANNFFRLAGLPLLNSSNFSLVFPQGRPANPQLGVFLGWDGEIALDLQWAHAIAPGARIVVVAASGQDSEDLQEAIHYAARIHLGNSFSNSYTEDTDLFSGVLEQTSWDDTIEYAAARGISVNFGSGDSGDEGLGSPVGSSAVPSNSPHATAVGGTAILNDPNSSTGGIITTGWGDSISALAAFDTLIDPPQPGGFIFGLNGGFLGGAGGGESVFFKKPSWQASLPGWGRQAPDVSALADPYTGVPILLTSGGAEYIFEGNGGTSLACPIFSAMWAIANQYAGQPLGQAAPTIAALAGQNSPYIVDVLPNSSASPANVTGAIEDDSGVTNYSATDIFSGVIEENTGFTSAILPLDEGDILDFGFGMDTSLTVTAGWDNVTGYGTPNVTAMGNTPMLP